MYEKKYIPMPTNANINESRAISSNIFSGVVVNGLNELTTSPIKKTKEGRPRPVRQALTQPKYIKVLSFLEASE